LVGLVRPNSFEEIMYRPPRIYFNDGESSEDGKRTNCLGENGEHLD